MQKGEQPARRFAPGRLREPSRDLLKGEGGTWLQCRTSKVDLPKFPPCLTGCSQITVRFYGSLHQDLMVISLTFSRRVPQNPGESMAQLMSDGTARGARSHLLPPTPPFLVPSMQTKTRKKDFSPESFLISWCIYNIELRLASSSYV